MFGTPYFRASMIKPVATFDVLFNSWQSDGLVVAQLAEQSLPTPEILDSNPDIGNDKFQTYICL